MWLYLGRRVLATTWPHGAVEHIYYGLLHHVLWKPNAAPVAFLRGLRSDLIALRSASLTMRFLNACASLLSIASLTEYVSANLKITADNHSFGGVNYPGLQTLNDAERDKVIRGIVKSGARVIRLFSTYLPCDRGCASEEWLKLDYMLINT